MIEFLMYINIIPATYSNIKTNKKIYKYKKVTVE